MRPIVTYDTKARRARLEVTAGVHVNVCYLMTLNEARALLADIEAVLPRLIENVETKPRDIPKPIRLPDDYIAECEPAGTRDR